MLSPQDIAMMTQGLRKAGPIVPPGNELMTRLARLLREGPGGSVTFGAKTPLQGKNPDAIKIWSEAISKKRVVSPEEYASLTPTPSRIFISKESSYRAGFAQELSRHDISALQ